MMHAIWKKFHSRKVERRETGEASRGHDQPVSDDVANEMVCIPIVENPKIQKVTLLRRHKRFHVPWVMSIGPIHHGKPEYRSAEKYKLALANNFIEESGKSEEQLFMVIRNKIEQLRQCFDEEVIRNYNDDEALARMFLVDGCAVLKFIHSFVEKKVKRFQINNGQVAFMRRDLFFLENQLPYQILNDLIQNSNESEKLRESVQSFIDMECMTRKTQEKPPTKEPVHLLDLLRNRLLGCAPISHGNNSYQEDWHSFRNVQELKAVGIHLKSSKDGCLGNITFTQRWKLYGGILSLPSITVNDSTRDKFFNLMAYEMCADFDNNFAVTTFIFFLDSLIDVTKDVIDLRKAGIIRNCLGSDDEVAQVFNEIGNNLVPNYEIYKDVRYKIQQYYEKRRMPWITEVIHNHFSNPWTVVAFIAGSSVLILSVLQTVYTVLGYYHPK